LPSAARLADFENAGPARPLVDVDQMLRAKIPTGPYRVVPGDTLQVEMPGVLDPQAAPADGAAGERVTYTLHVNDDGAITLPLVGDVLVVGKSLTAIEQSLAGVFYPEYVRTKPSIYVRVLEYQTAHVSVVGAVVNPGIYELRHDRMSLIALLMQAGGIIGEGAARIRIVRFGSSDIPPVWDPRGEVPVWRARQQGASPVSWSGASFRLGVFDGAGPRSYKPENRLVFEPQGALITTGWLVIEQNGDVVFRQWLDVGSEHQRQKVADSARKRSAKIAPTDLESGLLELASILETKSAGRPVESVARQARWRIEDDSFVMPHASADLPAGSTQKTLRGCCLAALEADDRDVETLVLPVRGLNIPFEDVVLNDGDSVIVERIDNQYVSVLGLVRLPGRFPYPPETRYTLAETLALAGGLDMVADPRFVSVYRLRSDGTVASATFQLVDPKNQEELTEQLAIFLKPGDVVSVEHTPRTRTNVFFDRVVRISLGFYLRPDTFWD
jgi:protein involved in polysaccharide export with SLBB domain